MSDPKNCGDCLHWRRMARPRGINGSVDMSPQVMGLCCEGPPVLQPDPRTGHFTQIGYLPLPEAFPACDRFALSPSLEVN